jgi:ligand-binding sensor domain-containing protein
MKQGTLKIFISKRNRTKKIFPKQKNYLLSAFISYLPLLFAEINTYGNNNNYQFTFEHIDVEQGLPSNSVNCIYQDIYGYIWIGTEDGLVKYDGKEFRVYKEDMGQRSIGHSAAISIYEDDDSLLWVGNRHTLELYNREKDAFIHFSFPRDAWNNIHYPVNTICKIEKNKYFIGTDGAGLFEMTLNRSIPEKSILKRVNDNIFRVSSIFHDKGDTFWIATFSDEIIKYIHSKKIWEKTKIIGNRNPEIRVIVGNKNKLILGCNNLGICIFDKQTNEYYFITKDEKGKNTIPSNRVWTICPDNYGNYWIGTDEGGLAYYDIKKKNFNLYQHYGFDETTISNNLVHAVFVDRENNLWVGHFHGGISFAKGNKIFYSLRSIPGYKNSLNNKMVTSILKDKNENIWIGTDGGGINIYNNQWEKIENSLLNSELLNKLKDKSILAIFEDSKSNIWLGTYLEGYYKYNLQTKKYKQYFNSSSPFFVTYCNDIRCFFEDKNNNIWIGTNGGGIYMLNPETEEKSVIVRDYYSNNTLSLNWIRSIIMDSYGFIWIATTYGLNSYDPIKKRFVNFFADKADTGSLSDNMVLSLLEDKNKNLWIGTRNGLNRYNRKSNSFKKFFKKDGLPNNTINSLIEDNKGNIWITTNSGLSMLDIQKNQFINYTKSDGLISSAFLENSSFIDKNGNIYAGSTDGMIWFNPASIKNNYTNAPIKITRLYIYNKEVEIGEKIDGKIILEKDISLTQSIKLKYKHNVISLNYSVLSYANKANQFRYKLSGLDPQWVYDRTNSQSVTYTNLKPGKYRFIVQLLDNANKPVSETGLDITVVPPFWMSIWFKFIAAIIILALIYSWYKQKIAKWEKQKAQLTQIMMEKKIETEKQQLVHQEEQLKLEIKKQEEIMAIKNSQLTSYVLQVTHKNEILQKIDNVIKQNHIGNLEMEEKLNKKIKDINKILENELNTEKDWERFEKHFNEVHVDFIQHLKKLYPDLGLSQLKICSYLKLDLSSKEIAFLLNITPRGVEKARSRLRKRFNLGPNDSLTEFLNRL